MKEICPACEAKFDNVDALYAHYPNRCLVHRGQELARKEARLSEIKFWTLVVGFLGWLISFGWLASKPGDDANLVWSFFIGFACSIVYAYFATRRLRL